jgi:hypothetical protein
MNPLPLSLDSAVSDIWGKEEGKAILETRCEVMTKDTRFQKAMAMTLKQIKPMSNGKLTQAMLDLVAEDLAKLPYKKECSACGEPLPI